MVVGPHRVHPRNGASQILASAEGKRFVEEDLGVTRPTSAVGQNVFDDCLVQTVSYRVSVTLRLIEGFKIEFSVVVAISFDWTETTESFAGGLQNSQGQTS